MRNLQELLESAMTLRRRLLMEGRDPTDSTFTVTEGERCVLRMQPHTSLIMDHADERFCGFKLYELPHQP